MFQLAAGMPHTSQQLKLRDEDDKTGAYEPYH